MDNDVVLCQILLNVNITNLIVISHINKRTYKIYTSDHFWKEYYHKYINTKYEIEVHLKVDGCWKKAFFKNYSIPKVLTSIDTPSLWNINYLTTFYDSNAKEKIQNYIDLNIHNAEKIFLVPIIPKSDESIFAHYTKESFDKNKHLWIEKGYEITYGSHVNLLNVNIYPYHHRLVFDKKYWSLSETKQKLGLHSIRITYGSLVFSDFYDQIHDYDSMIFDYFGCKKYTICGS